MNFDLLSMLFMEGQSVMTPVVVIRIILATLMLVAGIAAAILVLLQSSNSDGTSALSGGSKSGENDTFYGRNKGKQKEYKLKVWTFIVAGVLAVCSIVFFLLAFVK